MRSYIWTLSFIAAIVLFTGYKLMAHLSTVAPTIPAVASETPSIGTTTTPSRIFGNPLVQATKSDVSRWFPGNCFAEIYMKNPSLGGKMIGSCKTKVIQSVRAETGYTLTSADFVTSDVIAHFKIVYGGDGPWIQ